MDTLVELIAPFIRNIADGQVEIYNEFSLQHEIGIFLRTILPGQKVQFERNVTAFFSDKSAFSKREIDIVAFSPEKRTLDWALELKYPRNGQYPEQMFSFCKDIAFAEELKAAGFRRAAVAIFAEDHLFYEGASEGIYEFFRGRRVLHGRILKPTGHKDAEVTIRGRYKIDWRPVRDALKYTIIEMQ